jgi:hypothetical protein
LLRGTAQHQTRRRALIQFRCNGCQGAIRVHRVAEGFHYPGIAFTPRAKRAGLGKLHLQNGRIAGLARLHAAENVATLKLRKIQRLRPVKNRNHPIPMSKDGG